MYAYKKLTLTHVFFVTAYTSTMLFSFLPTTIHAAEQKTVRESCLCRDCQNKWLGIHRLFFAPSQHPCMAEEIEIAQMLWPLAISSGDELPLVNCVLDYMGSIMLPMAPTILQKKVYTAAAKRTFGTTSDNAITCVEEILPHRYRGEKDKCWLTVPGAKFNKKDIDRLRAILQRDEKHESTMTLTSQCGQFMCGVLIGRANNTMKITIQPYCALAMAQRVKDLIKRK